MNTLTRCAVLLETYWSIYGYMWLIILLVGFVYIHYPIQ